MIKYSVVIPTKSRSETLRHVLRTVLTNPRKDIEVVVHQCGPDPATDALAASIMDDRLRYFSTTEAIPMRQNWELAITHARGEFVTVIGDDDGLLPGAFELADALIAEHRPQILSWRPVTYYWPTYFDPALAGRAIYRYDIALGNIRFSSDYALRSLYRFKWHYSDMPMIYNSFVRGDLIDSIRKERGSYLFLNLPDVASGVVNVSHCDEFLWSNYPLSITGISSQSTGHRLVMQDDSSVKESAIRDLMPERVDQPWIASVSNLDFSIAAELLALWQMLGLERRGITVSMREVADSVARQLNRYRSQIPASRESLRAFCQRHEIDFDELAARFLLDASPAQAAGGEIETLSEVVIDRNLAEQGHGDIDAAARSIARLLGNARPAAVSRVGFDPARGAIAGEPEDLTFCRTGNAVQLLGGGWNRPEAFGTWACDYRASIRLPVPSSDGRIRIAITARGPITGAESHFAYAIQIPRARRSISGEFSARRWSGTDVLELDIAELGGDRDFELIFRGVDLVNAALLGIGDDNRPLGLGLEKITVSALPRQEGAAQ